MSLTDGTQIDNTGRAGDPSFAAYRPAVIVLVCIAVGLFGWLAVWLSRTRGRCFAAPWFIV